ncbi:DNA cytosine methyltransferase [Agrobacterium tumefaciens]|uniref:DNA cytosine methyltransferase n=1 Tax=Agrobacterium tumefaciens TaxID=358 RepID=UPI0015741060|nr:DNA cytosine methyltransferase [Agrobacterium tumefaciens]NTD85431.1 DNA cytosine methyltransferase [Agrobacterium tumefaciens]NTD90780.1 DNA cytosine methyltransferase [Agrobacterium tumefaciens]NTD96423.1 DNA cytosine methyltransferase [Agrobacterium tumefaciens]NTE15854.1 DNA cytosine methyltransferase [Agrobacterium tumefaciens]NTE23157.1 DNA cytosine methyltransferase [Agrobacterium tumefaciens]
MKKLLVADLLCGAGGSSTGAKRAIEKMGLKMELVCLNHWPVAIDTHQRNHREARHYVQDIATVRPHIIVPEGYLDLLMASPTCTHHSTARGGKPTSDQQRSDPWHIITWLTELRVKRIIIENVWEFISWGPVDHRTGKPVKSRKGEYFHAWIETIKRLGFEPEWRKLNAADYGGATTRQRFILMARSDSRKVSWPMPTHKKRDEVNGDLFSGAKPWRPASEIIDWSIKGKSIFNRKKALAPKTLARIWAGAVKHGWPNPYLVILRNHMVSQGMDEPIPTIAACGNHIAIAQPVVVNMKGKSTARGANEPLPTQTAHAPHLYAAEPIVLSQHSSGTARSTHEPLPTIMTGGAGVEERPGCARPMLIEPFVLSQASGGAARPVGEPIPTAPTAGAHALISPYYGSGSGETCVSIEEPLPTATAKARFGMVVPVTQSNGGATARDVKTDPLPTMTTAKGGEFAVVLPVTHAGGLERVFNPDMDGLPTITGANRGELAIAEATPEYDILFRMLEPHELAAAMGFHTKESRYEFAGTKTQQVKQIGNAVSVEKMEACVSALLADAAPRPKATFQEAAE